jgi:hypothetical protein
MTKMMMVNTFMMMIKWQHTPRFFVLLTLKMRFAHNLHDFDVTLMLVKLLINLALDVDMCLDICCYISKLIDYWDVNLCKFNNVKA